MWLSGNTEDAFPETEYGSLGELCKMDLLEGNRALEITVRRARKNLNNMTEETLQAAKEIQEFLRGKKGMPEWTRTQLR